MSNYSGTYLSVIIIIVAQILPLLGIKVGTDELTITIQVIVTVISGLVILYKRWIGNQAAVNVFGFRRK